MRIRICTILCYLIANFWVLPLAAQSPDSHQKARYVAPDGTIYHPMSEPLYVNIGTKADQTDISLNGGDTAGIFANKSGKFYLDVVKQNGLRIPNGRNVLIIDGSTPNSIHKFSNAPKAISRGNLYFGNGLICTLSSTDSYSGVKNTYAALNTTTFTPYANSLSITQEGPQELQYYAVDQVGNAESVAKHSFIVDLTPPVSSYEKEGRYFQDIFARSARIQLTSQDSLAGAAKIEWQLNKGSFRRYKSPILLTQLKDGKHTLSYKSTDLVKNEEALNTYEFAVDRIAPIVQFQFIGEYFVRDKIYLAANTQLLLFGVDNRSGIQHIYYNLDRRGEQIYEQPITFTDFTGSHSLHYYAIDKVGNSSKLQYAKVQFTFDTEAPRFNDAFEGPYVQREDTLFIREFTKIKTSITDSQSGLQQSTYQIDEGLPFPYNGVLRVRDAGFHQIRFTAKDWVNNSAQHELSVFVDRLPPNITPTVTGDSLGLREINSERYKIYSGNCSVSMEAQDQASGVDELYYVINGSLKRNYSTAIHNFKKKTPIILELFAVDQLGNTHRQVIRLYIED
ncbi:MAG: OmpL47-type beta-barrel domain-containing protein [Flammeovirgaceae bacterium]